MTDNADLPEFLTTQEVADLLRVKQRRVYDLTASGELPHTKATGKLLFRQADIRAWLGTRSTVEAVAAAPVVAGSHDPLLDWALRASGARLASFFDGSLDGLDLAAQGQAAVCGVHLFEPETGDWNLSHVEKRLPAGFVLIAWARRARGVLLAPGLTAASLPDLAGRRLIARQAQAGAQIVLEHHLAAAGMSLGDFQLVGEPARTEGEAAAAIAAGQGDVAPGIAAMARDYKLDFLPLTQERYDLAVDRRFWFEPPWQTLIGFARTKAFGDRAAEMPGYDVSDLGTVRWNGA